MTEVACHSCGVDLAASPSAVALLEGGAVAVCATCAADEVLTSAKSPRLALTPGAEAEVDARRLAFAKRRGVPVEDVAAWPPRGLAFAADSQERRN